MFGSLRDKLQNVQEGISARWVKQSWNKIQSDVYICMQPNKTFAPLNFYNICVVLKTYIEDSKI